MEDCVGKAFELTAIEVTVGAKNAPRLAGPFVEDVDLAALEEPAIVRLREDASVLAIRLPSQMAYRLALRALVALSTCAV
jgi:hypothetical protein